MNDGQAKEGSVFTAAIITYKIKTAPLGYEVRRKDADFVFLRKILNRQFPYIAVPPCTLAPPSKTVPKAIEKRERYYTRFL